MPATKKTRKPRPKAQPGARPLKKVIDPRLIKALAHPLRADVLITLSEKVASPRELASEVGLDVSEVSYHVRELKKAQCIELVRTKRRRGAVEHFYRATTRFLLDDEEWGRLPDSARSSIAGDILRLIVGEAGAALKSGALEAPAQHLSRTPMAIDEQGWAEVLATMERALHEILAIQARSGARLARTGGEALTATVALLGFETAEQ